MESSQLVKNLRFLMEKHSETTNAVAVSSGIKASTLMRLLDGSSAAPRNSTLQALAMHFGVTPGALMKLDLSVEAEELVEHKNVSEPISLLMEDEVFQVYYWNEEDTAKENTFSYRRLSNDRTWISAPPDQELIDLIKEESDALLPAIFAFTVKGNAMAPTLSDGDIVYVRYTPTEPMFDQEGDMLGFFTPNEVKNGDFVLAYGSKKDEETKKTRGYMVVRQFCKGDTTSFDDYLVSTNPDWPGERSLICERIIGKIVGRYTKF